MPTHPLLRDLLPELIEELRPQLEASGHAALMPQLEVVAIERCTNDIEAEAGYIYLVRPQAATPAAGPPVASTLTLAGYEINIDLDHEGRLFGIELLERPKLIAKLKVH